jgi:DNA-binding XRE family transcriptional regulator
MMDTLVRTVDALQPNLCKRGHDKNVVGVDASNYCKQCKRDLDKTYYEKRKLRALQREVCHKGHKLDEVGRVWGGKCRECARMAAKRYYYRRRRPLKLSNPNGFLNAKRIPHLRAMREKMGYSRLAFARATGVSKDVLEGIENGGRARPAVLEKILSFVAMELEREKVERYA